LATSSFAAANLSSADGEFSLSISLYGVECNSEISAPIPAHTP